MGIGQAKRQAYIHMGVACCNKMQVIRFRIRRDVWLEWRQLCMLEQEQVIDYWWEESENSQTNVGIEASSGETIIMGGRTIFSFCLNAAKTACSSFVGSHGIASLRSFVVWFLSGILLSACVVVSVRRWVIA